MTDQEAVEAASRWFQHDADVWCGDCRRHMRPGRDDADVMAEDLLDHLAAAGYTVGRFDRD